MSGWTRASSIVLWLAIRCAFSITPSGLRGSMLRAYDKATGTEVGAVYMPAPQSGSPMTYMLNGTPGWDYGCG